MNGSSMQKKRYGRYGLNHDIMSIVIGDTDMMVETQDQNDYNTQSFATNQVEQNSKSIETLRINGTSHQVSRNNLNEENRENDRS